MLLGNQHIKKAKILNDNHNIGLSFSGNEDFSCVLSAFNVYIHCSTNM